MAYISGESRYRNLDTYRDDNGRIVLKARVPVRYEEREDNIFHVAGEGETWFTIAERYYEDISSRACGLWWVVAEYQPQPVLDPTLKIRPGTEVVLPSPAVVATEILQLKQAVYQ